MQAVNEDLIASSRATASALSKVRDKFFSKTDPLYREAGRAIVAIDMLCAALRQGAQPAGVAAEVSSVVGAGPNDVGVRWRGGIVSVGTKLYTAVSGPASSEKAAVTIRLKLDKESGEWLGMTPEEIEAEDRSNPAHRPVVAIVAGMLAAEREDGTIPEYFRHMLYELRDALAIQGAK